MTAFYRQSRSGLRKSASVLAVLAAVSVAACGPQQEPDPGKGAPPQVGNPADTNPARAGKGRAAKVAILLPLTGKFERLGKAMRKAAEMAVFDNAAKNFQLVPIDTGGTPDGAAAAMRQAIEQRVDLVLGPLFSASVAAVKGPAAAAKLNVVAFSTDVAVAGGNVYLISFVPRPQVERIIDYAARQGHRRIAILAPRGTYGDLVIGYARNVAQRYNAAIVRVGRYGNTMNDLTNDVKAFASAGPVDFDAILIPDGGQRLRLAASFLDHNNVSPRKVKFLGTGLWHNASIRTENALERGWFAAPAPNGYRRFAARYRKSNGQNPPRLASLAYDAVALAASLAKANKNSKGPVYSRAALADPSGFLGIDGIFRFSGDGTADRGLAVLEVRPQQFRVISPAATTFAKGTN